MMLLGEPIARLNGARPLPEAQRQAILRLIRRLGERETARVLHVTRQTLGRALAGLPIREGTAVLIETQLGR